MRAPLFLTMLAVLALFTACAIIAMRFREAASHRIAAVSHGYKVTGFRGNESSSGGWEVGEMAELERGGSKCVAITGGGESDVTNRN